MSRSIANAYWLLQTHWDPCEYVSCAPSRLHHPGTLCDIVDMTWHSVHQSEPHVAANDQYTVDKSSR